jgi:hypothetical protein
MGRFEVLDWTGPPDFRGPQIPTGQLYISFISFADWSCVQGPIGHDLFAKKRHAWCDQFSINPSPELVAWFCSQSLLITLFCWFALSCSTHSPSFASHRHAHPKSPTWSNPCWAIADVCWSLHLHRFSSLLFEPTDRRSWSGSHPKILNMWFHYANYRV